MSPFVTPAVSRRSFIRTSSLAASSVLMAGGLRAQAAGGRKLGVALVGLGGYATGQLAPALKLTEHCRLAGVVTGDAAKGRRWASEHGFPESNIWHYDTMHQMADNPDIDIVYVVTPNALHAEHCIKAAEAGKHVTSEKPFTVSVAEADAVIAKCREMGVKLSIGYRLHFEPHHEVLRELARTQKFGRFMKQQGNFSFVMRGMQWRAQHALAGGGPLMDLGVYVIQEACMAAGGVAPVAVTARQLPKERPDFFQDVEESIEWTMEFPGGEVCEAACSYNGRGNQFRAEAANGWFEVQPAFGYGGIRAQTSEGPVDVPNLPQQALQMDDFARCVKEDRVSKVSGEMGRRDMVILEGIYAAMNSGERVAITGA